VSTWHTYSKDYASIVSSNLKFLINLGDREQIYYSIDSGQNGRIFHKHYGDLTERNEKGELIKAKLTFDNTLVDIEFKPPTE
jgi:hypothetical protein